MPSANHHNTHSSPADCTIVIMAKAPRIGGVKSRLTPHLAASDVVELYRCLLQDTVSLTQSLSGVDVAMMCPPADVEELSRIVDDGVNVVPQTGNGLAAALTSVFVHFTSTARRIIALDSDSPHLPAKIIQTAFDKLAFDDLVVGPTHDGGYYLVGAKTSHAGLFDSDGMGTASALDALLLRANALGLSIAHTDHFYDIDVDLDLKRLAADLLIAPERAPRTAAWLRGWGPFQPHGRPGLEAP